MPSIIFRGLIAVIILAIGIGTAAFLVITKEKIPARPIEEKIWTVSVVEVESQDIHPDIRAYGEIVAAQTGDVRSLVAGPVSYVSANFVDGGVVTEGEELFRIDSFDYDANLATAEAQLAEAMAAEEQISVQIEPVSRQLEAAKGDLEISRRAFDRVEGLNSRGNASDSVLDTAEAAVIRLEQQIAQYEQNLAILEQQQVLQQNTIERLEVGVDRATRDLEETVFYAAFDGVLVNTNISVGKQVSMADQLGQIIAMGSLEAKFQLMNRDYVGLLNVSEAEGGGILNRDIEVIWRLGDSDIIIPAKIVRQEGQIDAASGGVNLYARLEDIDSADALRVGAFIEVIVPDVIYREVYVLPRRAVTHDGVIYMVEDGRLARHDVEILRYIDDEVIVRAELPDLPIVTTHFPEISEGLKVQMRGLDDVMEEEGT